MVCCIYITWILWLLRIVVCERYELIWISQEDRRSHDRVLSELCCPLLSSSLMTTALNPGPTCRLESRLLQHRLRKCLQTEWGRSWAVETPSGSRKLLAIQTGKRTRRECWPNQALTVGTVGQNWKVIPGWEFCMALVLRPPASVCPWDTYYKCNFCLTAKARQSPG